MEIWVCNLCILSTSYIMKHVMLFAAISELDSLREESGSVSYRVGFLGEFEVGKTALKMAYTCTYLLQRYHTFGVQYSLAATKRFLGLISKLLASYV